MFINLLKRSRILWKFCLKVDVTGDKGFHSLVVIIENLLVKRYIREGGFLLFKLLLSYPGSSKKTESQQEKLPACIILTIRIH